MAALFEITSRGPATVDREPASPHAEATGTTAALAYINRCLRGHRPFGIMTGSTPALAAFVERAAAHCAARDDLHPIRVPEPTDSVQAFLTACLAQLGFDLVQAALDDLHNLFVVFLRHEGARGRRTVALIESTEHYGPRVLEFMQTLSKVRAGATPAITFVLTGSRDLHRVLDSPGMAGLRHLTRERFDLDRALAWVTPAGRQKPLSVPVVMRHVPQPALTGASHAAPGRLIVMLDGAIVGRRVLEPGKLVIGRSPRSGLRLESRYVSRHHAVLIVTPEATTIVDLRSTNTTLVNGQATTSHLLEHGDMLAIGNFRLRFDSRPQ